jgi:hypothetical protein
LATLHPLQPHFGVRPVERAFDASKIEADQLSGLPHGVNRITSQSHQIAGRRNAPRLLGSVEPFAGALQHPAHHVFALRADQRPVADKESRYAAYTEMAGRLRMVLDAHRVLA